MPRRETSTKGGKKTLQRAKAARKAVKKAAAKAGKKGGPADEAVLSRGVEQEGAPAPEPAAKKRGRRKLDRKRLGELVDKMLLQLAERVEEGEFRITTSEGMKLIQLREVLGLDRPSKVKVEWVEPKGE